jgi:RES domain.
MRCCSNCFGDRGLNKIFPSRSEGIGNCDYCGSRDVPTADPRNLGDLLSTVLNIYDADAEGVSIVEHLRNDWGLFGNPAMDDFRIRDLLAAITEDDAIGRRTYLPAARFKSDRLFRWEELRVELMNRNRYFPDSDIDKERLAELLNFLQAEDMPAQWFRARIQAGEAAFPIDQMGAPPGRIASHGRANPPGIPYLYVGSDEHTAISEIRPHTGEIASVASFAIDPAVLKLVDLRAPKERVSPFDLGDEDKIGALRSDIAFLERLGDELTRPVVPQGAAIDYVPSQYLCEFIKKAGWDGVVYRSSVGEGINLALFDEAKAAPGAVKRWKVDRVTVEARHLEAH